MTKSSNLTIEEQLHAAAHAAEPRREFADELWRQMAATPARQPAGRWATGRRALARPAWAAAGVLALTAVIILLIGPSRVAAAFYQLIGYLPGIGFVEEGASTLYLPEAVTVEQQGLSLTVEQAVADAHGTMIAYHIDGLEQTQTGGMAICVYDRNQLRLPEGRTLLPTGGGIAGSQARIEFFPLPEGVDHVTLLVSMLEPDPACTAPPAWEVDLDLSPLPPQLTLMPVYAGEDIQAPGAGAVTGLPAATPAGQTEAAPGPALQLAIDRVAELTDGYLVAAHAEWQDPTWQSVYPEFDSLEVVDANGRSLPVAPSEEGASDGQFAFKVIGKDAQAPFTVKVHALNVWAILEDGGPAFSFDAGTAPHNGQGWRIDQALEVGGYEVVIDAVRAVRNETNGAAATEGPNGYAIEFHAAPQIHNLDFLYSGDPPAGAVWGQGRNGEDSGKIMELYFPEGLPTGQVTLQVWNVQYLLDGSWQASWQLPAASE
ncbi:MAG: DUF4179 domain-containing protein [Anaerolineaceae bacterium]|nr:DUF4179 domain-containing protein [Anaerolineaceae bacterium]